MTEDTDPVKALTTARDRMIEERRALTIAIALGYRRRRSDDGQANEMRETFIDIQNLVDAMERAIAHEKMMRSGELESPTTLALNAVVQQ